MIWLVPLLVVVVGAVAVGSMAMRTADAWRRLVWELRQLGTVRPALLEVRTAGQALGAGRRGASPRNGSRT